MKFDHITFNCLQIFGPAIMYSDHTGLTDDESEALTGYLSNIEVAAVADKKFKALGHYTPGGERCEFARCEITDQLGAVESFSYVFEVQE